MARKRKLDEGELSGHVWDLDDAVVILQGQEVPRRFSVRLAHPEWPVMVALNVTVDPDRGPIATGLSIDDSPGADRTLERLHANRSEPVDIPSYRELDDLLAATIEMPRLLRRLTADAVGALHKRRMLKTLGADLDETRPDYRDEMRALTDQVREEARALSEAAHEFTQPRRRRVVSKQHLIEVAEVYRDALAAGLPPTKQVEEHFHTTHSTASRWVGLAREGGQLRKSIGTKPGEAER